jgi:hypothetical protein
VWLAGMVKTTLFLHNKMMLLQKRKLALFFPPFVHKIDNKKQQKEG